MVHFLPLPPHCTLRAQSLGCGIRITKSIRLGKIKPHWQRDGRDGNFGRNATCSSGMHPSGREHSTCSKLMENRCPLSSRHTKVCVYVSVGRALRTRFSVCPFGRWRLRYGVSFLPVSCSLFEGSHIWKGGGGGESPHNRGTFMGAPG